MRPVEHWVLISSAKVLFRFSIILNPGVEFDLIPKKFLGIKDESLSTQRKVLFMQSINVLSLPKYYF